MKLTRRPAAAGEVALAARPAPSDGWRGQAARLSTLVLHPLAIVFLLALAARLCQLTYHSLWFDEVMSTYWAAKPAAEIWRVGLALAQDKHPPLYYLLLHVWTRVFGGGDAAVRAPGALIGALAVLPTYGIGARLGGRRSGLLAALLLAVNPFLVWYSQEARMFAPATTFGLVGLWGVLRLTDGRSPGMVLHLLCAVCGLSAALYSYLFSAFLLPVAAVWVMLVWWANRRRAGAGWQLGLGAAALAFVGLLFLPLARAAWGASGSESVPGRAFEGIGPALWRLLSVYTVGWPHWSGRMAAWAAGGAGLLALVGWVGDGISAIRRRLRSGGAGRLNATVPSASLFYLSWLIVPVVLGGLLLARDRTVFAETRYFIFLVPVLCLAWGQGVAWLWARSRAAGMVGLALMLGVTLAALPSLWSPQNRREAWREAAAFVEAHAGPNDAILVQVDYVHLAFDRYFRGHQPVFFPFTDRITDPAAVDAPLVGLAGFDAVWLVQSHHPELDPANLVAGWFGARYPLITEAYPAGIAIHGFAQTYRTPRGSTPSLSPPDWPLQLLRCEPVTRRLAARDDLFHPPSGWVHVTTYWAAAGPRPNQQPVMRLVDAQGQVWGISLDRPNGAFRLWPPVRWLDGEAVRADFDVNLNPAAPPGSYRLIVAIPTVEQTVLCGDVAVE